MKKILLALTIVLLTVSSTFAYTQNELTAKMNTYKTVIKQKIGGKLENISEVKLRKILTLVDSLVIKYENQTTITDAKKLQKIAILIAFKEIVNEKLEDEFSDINSILNTVNTQYGPIFIISDTRCGTICDTQQLVIELREIAQLKDSKIVELDFASLQAKDLLKTTGIIKLPAAIFPDNSVLKLSAYLNTTNNKSYSLELGSTYNPYEERSDKGFKVLNKQTLSEIKASSYIKGNNDAEVLWLEYSDMECPFCAKLHNNGTLKDLEEKYGTKLASSLQHFPLAFHKNALPAAHYLECTGKLKGSTVFYNLEEKIFSSKDSSKEFILEAAFSLGVDKTKLQTCVDSNVFSSKITAQQKRGTEVFGVTGTPGNVLINTKTGEYDVISGAYPTASFVEIIDRLLK